MRWKTFIITLIYLHENVLYNSILAIEYEYNFMGC